MTYCKARPCSTAGHGRRRAVQTQIEMQTAAAAGTLEAGSQSTPICQLRTCHLHDTSTNSSELCARWTIHETIARLALTVK